MKAVLINQLPWLLSLVTIASVWMAGDKRRHAWSLGVANQGLWLVWIIASGTWGLLPMTIVLGIVCGRNYLKWQGDRWT